MISDLQDLAACPRRVVDVACLLLQFTDDAQAGNLWQIKR